MKALLALQTFVTSTLFVLFGNHDRRFAGKLPAIRAIGSMSVKPRADPKGRLRVADEGTALEPANHERSMHRLHVSPRVATIGKSSRLGQRRGRIAAIIDQ